MGIYVSETNIYPIKSTAANKVISTQITPLGPLHDREWMLVRDDAKKVALFLTQRNDGFSKLANILATPDLDNTLNVTAPGHGSLTVHKAGATPWKPVRIFKDLCQSLDAGDRAAEYFSSYCGEPCRLVTMPDDFMRATSPKYTEPGTAVSFADGYPMLITSTASLDALNASLSSIQSKIPMACFRPNIVLNGLDPFEEDTISRVRIGDVTLQVVKPSARCKVVTIAQDNGQVAYPQTLEVLTQFRKGSAEGLSGVFFGQNAVLDSLPGKICVGDNVEILETQPMHPAIACAQLKYEP